MRLLDRIVVRFGNLVAWLFLIVAGIIVYEVVARYVFNAPTFWAHETTVLLAALAFIVGGAYCMAEDSHMRITSLTDRLGPGVRRLSDFLSYIVGLVYLGGLAFATWRMSDKSLFRFTPDGVWNPETSGSSWNPPFPSFMKFALFLGTVLFLIIILSRIITFFRRDGRTDGAR